MAEGDETARQKLIEHNLRLVLYVARKFLNTSYEIEELFSVGSIGLIKSIDTFDINKDVLFITYANRCIENEILMFLRKDRCYQNLFFPETATSAIEFCDLKSLQFTSFEEQNFVLDYEKREVNRIVQELILELPDLEKEIMIKYFYEEMIQSDIEKYVHVSQSYISRVIRNTLKDLKSQLENMDIIESRTDNPIKRIS